MARVISCVVLMLVAAPSFTAAADPAVVVTPVTAADYAARVAKYKGQVVLVDCWATWCVPCVKAFPKTVALQQELADQGLVVCSLCFDTLDDEGQVPPRVIKFLATQPGQVVHLISQADLSDGADQTFEITDGALPHFKLYGRDGKLIATFGGDKKGAADHEVVRAAVLAALKK